MHKISALFGLSFCLLAPLFCAADKMAPLADHKMPLLSICTVVAKGLPVQPAKSRERNFDRKQ